ncbi:hypothetical protein HA466_0017160 [Hirschfeldia incana]|nr:hypothetical protein HA466_0017160 [Hirschfeldia incana]
MMDHAFLEMIWFCWEKDMVNSHLAFIVKDEFSTTGNVSFVTISFSIVLIRSQWHDLVFPYEQEFVKYFNWDNPELAPCGLINFGNSLVDGVSN